MPWQKFPSPAFGTKFQREVPVFLEIPNFPKIQCSIGRGKPYAKNQLDPWNHFDKIPDDDDNENSNEACGAGHLVSI